MPAFAGLRFLSATALSNGMVLKPVFQVAYEHEFSPERKITGSKRRPGAVFLVYGARPARDAAQVKRLLLARARPFLPASTVSSLSRQHLYAAGRDQPYVLITA